MILSLTALAAIAIYVAYCSIGGSMPRCMLKWATGFDCPGCGSQRAALALIHGHPLEAWRYNLLLPPVVAYLLAICLLPLMKSQRAQRVERWLTQSGAIWTLLTVTIVWWIVRNFLHI